MADDRQPGVAKLTESNWLVWKMQLMNYLMARELWDLCDGSEAVPVQGPNALGASVDVHEVRLNCDVSSGHPGVSAYRAGHSGNSDDGCCEFHCRGCGESGDFHRDCQRKVQGTGGGSRGRWRRLRWYKGRTASNFAKHAIRDKAHQVRGTRDLSILGQTIVQLIEHLAAQSASMVVMNRLRLCSCEALFNHEARLVSSGEAMEDCTKVELHISSSTVMMQR